MPLLATLAVQYIIDATQLIPGATAVADVLAEVEAVATASSASIDALGVASASAGAGLDTVAASVEALDSSLAGSVAEIAAVDESLASVAVSADEAVVGIGGVTAMSTDYVVGMGGVTAASESASLSLDGLALSADAVMSSIEAAIVSLTAIVGFMIGGGLASSEMAADYEQSMNKVQALTGDSTSQMAQFDTQLKSLAEQSGVAPTKLADGLYNVISAGYQGADAMTVLSLATKDSVIGMTDAKTTTDALTNVMASFSKKAQDANQVNGEMLETVTLGKSTFEQYASTIVKSASAASQFHVSMETMNAAFATMTSSGIKSAQASTDFQASLKVMDGNIGTVAKSLNKSGIAFDENKFNAMDYGHQVVYLNGALEQANTKHVKVTGVTLQAAQAINTIASHISTYNTDLTTLSNKQAMAQKTQEAWGTTVGGFNVSMQKLQATAQVAMIDIGQKLLPPATAAINQLAVVMANPGFAKFAITVGTDIFNGVSGLITIISILVGWGSQVVSFFQNNQVAGDALIAVLTGAAVVMGIFAVAALVALVPAFIAWTVAAGAAAIATLAATWPILAIGAAIALVVFGIILAIQHWGAIMHWLQWLIGTICSAVVNWFQWLWDTLVGHSIIPDMINGIVQWFEQLPGRAGAAIQDLWTKAVNLFNSFLKDALDFGSNIVKNIANGISGAIHFITGAITNVTQAIANFLPHSPAKVGPLADLEQTGLQISNQISKGMVNGVPIITSAIANLMKPVSIGMKGVTSSSAAPSQSQGGSQDNSVHIYLDGKELSDNAMNRMVKSQRRGPIR